MKAFVTGATGFIGANLVRELLRQGYQVRALARRQSDLRNVQGLDLELAYGDLRDADSVRQAVAGCDVLFHAAAAYTFWSPDPRSIYDTNVAGTENMLRAARDCGIRRVVYTSTESTIGVNGHLGAENMEIDPDHLPGIYKKSKYLAEKLALKMCREGLPVVIVNPTVPVGPLDIKPTPTGRLIVDFLNGRMPAYVNTGLNVVDAGDVAAGHILALEKGRPGERYILGHSNMTLKQMLDMLERITGIKAPRLRIPVGLAMGAAYLNEFVSTRLRGGPPRIPVAAVKAASHFRCFDCSKAVGELGLPQTPVEESLERAVSWFQQNGYVRKSNHAQSSPRRS